MLYSIIFITNTNCVSSFIVLPKVDCSKCTNLLWIPLYCVEFYVICVL